MGTVRHRLALGLTFVVMLLACSDDASITDPLPITPPAALLKDIVIPNLPSPYYHFEYDAAYRIKVATFASDARVYEVTWQRDRIVKMTNTVGSRDTLVYVYDAAGHVGTINYVDASGVVQAMVTLTYQGSQLTQLERRVRINSAFVTDKTMTFTYYTDGNLKDIVEKRPAITGIHAATTTTDHFDQYDTAINVDGFSLLHDDFNDSLILLPGVQLQQGNPAREVFTGDGPNYTVDYTWSYDDQHRPITKSGDLAFTTGPRTGEHFSTLSTFTYY